MFTLNKNKFSKEVVFFFQFILKYHFHDDNNQIKKLVLHFFKSHFLVILFIRISFFYLNILSLFMYGKKFLKIDFKDLDVILMKIENIKILQSNKIIELFHAITTIHLDGKESKIKIKIDDDLKNGDFFENVVIGSGPGGSITANELNNANKKVLLIEKGVWFKHFKLKHPGEEFLGKWKNGGLAAALGNVKIQYASAECFGGGSEINSGLYHEPDEDFLNTWCTEFNTKEISYNDLKFFIDKTKIKTNVSFLKNYLPITNEIINSSKKNNWKIEEIPRWISEDQGNYHKKSMTESYLDEYLKKNGKVSLNSEVLKIKKKDNLWKIDFIKNNKKISINSKNIFLCCGSIDNIRILKKNNLIKKSGKISFHPMIKIIAKFPKKVNKKYMEILTHQITQFFPDFLMGNAASGLPFLKIATQHDKSMYEDVKNDWQNMLIFHSTFSIGSGEVLNIPFLKDPIVNYKIEKKYIKMVKKGLEKLCKLMIDAGCIYIYPIAKKSIKLDKNNYKDYIESLKKITDLNYSTVHIMGGVPMGENYNCLVNSYGKLNNNDNFYINDSSLICNKLLKNPQGTVMAVALRNINNFLLKDK